MGHPPFHASEPTTSLPYFKNKVSFILVLSELGARLGSMPEACSSAPASIVGLALTLDPAHPALNPTLAVLRQHSGVTLGEYQAPFLPLVLESAALRSDHAWLESLPAVRAVDVAFVEIASGTVPSAY